MNENCICCLSAGANGKQAASATALATVIGVGLDQVVYDLCPRHREIVNGAVRHAQQLTTSQGSK